MTLPEFYLAFGHRPQQYFFIFWTAVVIFQKHYVIRITKVVDQMRIGPNTEGKVFFKTYDQTIQL
jgi:hypothetical protein